MQGVGEIVPAPQAPAAARPASRARRLLRWLRRLCPCALLLSLWAAGVARAEEPARPAAVRAASLAPDPTETTRGELARASRDLARWHDEERQGYFEVEARRRRERRVKGYYRKLLLRQLRHWSRGCLDGWVDDDGLRLPCRLPGGGGSEPSQALRWLEETDVELGYGSGGASLTLGHDLDLRPWGGRSGRVEVDPVRQEVEVGVELDHSSLAWTVGHGQVRLSWSIPF